MRKSLAEVWRRLQTPPEILADWCERRGVLRFAVYGSVLYRQFPPDSDINVLLRFAPGAAPEEAERVLLTREVAALLRRPTTVVDEDGLHYEASTFKRLSILGTAQTLFQRRLATEGPETVEMEFLPPEELEWQEDDRW